MISPKTAGNHIEHIYLKTGCSSRAEASLYAMQQGLLGELRAAQYKYLMKGPSSSSGPESPAKPPS